MITQGWNTIWGNYSSTSEQALLAEISIVDAISASPMAKQTDIDNVVIAGDTLDSTGDAKLKAVINTATSGYNDYTVDPPRVNSLAEDMVLQMLISIGG